MDERNDAEEQKEAGTVTKESVDRSVEDGEGGDDGGEHQLDGENTVDLADQAPSKLVLPQTQTRVQRLSIASLKINIFPILGAQARESVHLFL